MATIEQPIEYLQTTGSRPRNTRSNRRVEVRPPEQLRPQARPVDVGMGVAQDPSVATLETLNRALTQDLPRAAAALGQVAKFAKGEAADFAATEAANTSAETYEAFVDEAATPEERQRRSTLNPYNRAAVRERLGANFLGRRVTEFPAALRAENERRVAENEGGEVESDVLPVLDYFDDPESYEAFVRTHFELSPDANEHFREGYYGGLPREIEKILRTASEQAERLQLVRVDDSTRTDVGGLLQGLDLRVGSFGPEERNATYDALLGEVEENASLGGKTDAEATALVVKAVMDYTAGQTNDTTFTADKAEVFFDLAKKLAGAEKKVSQEADEEEEDSNPVYTKILADIATAEATIRKRLEQTTESAASVRATKSAEAEEEWKQVVLGAVTGKRPLTNEEGNELPPTRDNLIMAAAAFAGEREFVSYSALETITTGIYDGVSSADRKTALSVSQAMRWVETRFVPEAELDELLAGYNKDDRKEIQTAWDNNKDYYAVLENRLVKEAFRDINAFARSRLGVDLSLQGKLDRLTGAPSLTAAQMNEVSDLRDMIRSELRGLAQAGDADELGAEDWGKAVKALRSTAIDAIANVTATPLLEGQKPKPGTVYRRPAEDFASQIRATTAKYLPLLQQADTFRGYGRPASAPEAVPSVTTAPAAPAAAPEAATPSVSPAASPAPDAPAPVPMPTPEQKKEDVSLVLTAASGAAFIGAGGYDPNSSLAFDSDIALTLVGMTPDVFRDVDASFQTRLTQEELERVNARGPNLADRFKAGVEAVAESYGEAARLEAEGRQQATVEGGEALTAAAVAIADGFANAERAKQLAVREQTEAADEFIYGEKPTPETRERRARTALRDRKQGTEVADN